MITSKGKIAKAFAPASVANVAVGFDLLGFSAGFTGDTATVETTASIDVSVGPSSGLELKLPTDPLLNTATAGLVQLIKDRNLKHGFKVSIQKGIPLGSGLGGSAASAVAAIVAANALLDKPLSKNEMLRYALIGESKASGSFHADNIAPSLYGGLVLSTVEKDHSVEVVELPIPENLWCVVLHQHIAVETKSARGILKEEISLENHIHQSANLAFVMSGLFNSDFSQIARGLKDVVIEPQRAHLIPGFHAIQKAALTAGALGCTISGAGPSVFAWCEGQNAATDILEKMEKAAPGPASSWVFAVKNDGARILS